MPAVEHRMLYDLTWYMHASYRSLMDARQSQQSLLWCIPNKFGRRENGTMMALQGARRKSKKLQVYTHKNTIWLVTSTSGLDLDPFETTSSPRKNSLKAAEPAVGLYSAAIVRPRTSQANTPLVHNWPTFEPIDDEEKDCTLVQFVVEEPLNA